jgi:hypothetical protein
LDSTFDKYDFGATTVSEPFTWKEPSPSYEDPKPRPTSTEANTREANRNEEAFLTPGVNMGQIIDKQVEHIEAQAQKNSQATTTMIVPNQTVASQQLFSFFQPNPAPQAMNPFFSNRDKALDTTGVDILKKEIVEFKNGAFSKSVVEVINKAAAWYLLRNHLIKFRGNKVELSESTVSVLYHEAYKWCEDRHMQPVQTNECVNKALTYLVQDEPERIRYLQVINLLSVKEVDKNKLV